MYAKKNVSVKVLVVLLCVVLLIGGAIGGTVAYLMTNTDPVTNTFTAGDVNIEFAEPNFKEDEAIMVPGHTIAKDPQVTVKANSEDCYVFVKIEKSANFDTYMEYEVIINGDNEWIALGDGYPGVYYREVDKNSADDQTFHILKDDVVKVKDTVTKTIMEEAKTSEPTLKFTAYAIQKYSSNSQAFEVEEAWTKVSTPATP